MSTVKLSRLTTWAIGFMFASCLSATTYALADSLGDNKQYTLKFATLAPIGSAWMNLMEAWAAEVKTKSNGRLTFKFYPGGVQGDEPDVLKKMRFGQLQGGAFTGHGIGEIYSPARVLEMPFLFKTHGEIDYVRKQFMPEIEKGFRANGYELLGWFEVGFVHFFSKVAINSLDDLKKRRIWLWQDDHLIEAMFAASDLAPIPLSITDVFTSLSTGLIDTVPCTPLAAIGLQWFTKTEYMTKIPMSNAISALVASNRFFEKLPADLQALLKETGRKAGDRLIQVTREDNSRSLAVLQKKGLKFVFGEEDVDIDELIAIRDGAAVMLAKDGYIPKEVFERTKSLLEEYRSKQVIGACSINDDRWG